MPETCGIPDMVKSRLIEYSREAMELKINFWCVTMMELMRRSVSRRARRVEASILAITRRRISGMRRARGLAMLMTC